MPTVPFRVHGYLARFAAFGTLDGRAGTRPSFTVSATPRVWMTGYVTMDGRVVIG